VIETDIYKTPDTLLIYIVGANYYA